MNELFRRLRYLLSRRRFDRESRTRTDRRDCLRRQCRSREVLRVDRRLSTLGRTHSSVIARFVSV